ncbi:MAG: hypothetical protein A2Z02_01005 [Chloroflexi bacterium RBG_16_48_7]|nr:MAG: hypothetical protein A2Z02_01005 [Chloroflexi bacterium RBG_16_48_7]
MNAEGEKYELCVKGHLDERWMVRFEGMTVKTNFDQLQSPITLISGLVPDQAALHGILATIRDLGITVISINRVETENE